MLRSLKWDRPPKSCALSRSVECSRKGADLRLRSVSLLFERASVRTAGKTNAHASRDLAVPIGIGEGKAIRMLIFGPQSNLGFGHPNHSLRSADRSLTATPLSMFPLVITTPNGHIELRNGRRS